MEFEGKPLKRWCISWIHNKYYINDLSLSIQAGYSLGYPPRLSPWHNTLTLDILLCCVRIHNICNILCPQVAPLRVQNIFNPALSFSSSLSDLNLKHYSHYPPCCFLAACIIALMRLVIQNHTHACSQRKTPEVSPLIQLDIAHVIFYGDDKRSLSSPITNGKQTV